MGGLTSHWELKLVAVVLATALWIYTSGQVRSDRTLDVQFRDIQVSGLRDDYQITAIKPDQFRVTLSVPSNRLVTLPTNNLLTPRLEVRPDALPHRQQEYAVTSALLGLPSDVRIISTEPPNLRALTVQWDYIIPDELPAELPPVLGVPPGFEAEVAIDINLVPVRGAADVIERERARQGRVRFQPITIGAVEATASTTQEFTSLLRAVDNLPYKVQRVPVATVRLRPLPATLQVPAVAVQVLMPRDAVGKIALAIEPARVALTVRGPENLLKALKPDSDLAAYIDLRRGIEPGADRDVPVSLLAPPWLAYDAISVRIVATRAVGDPAPESGGPPQGQTPADPDAASAPAPAPAPPEPSVPAPEAAPAPDAVAPPPAAPSDLTGPPPPDPAVRDEAAP